MGEIRLTRTMRYEIKYNHELYDLLSDMQYAVWRVKNKAVSMAWDWQQFSFGYNERFGEYPSATKILGKGVAPDIYGYVKGIADTVYSMKIDNAVQDAVMKLVKEMIDVLAVQQTITIYIRDESFT